MNDRRVPLSWEGDVELPGRGADPSHRTHAGRIALMLLDGFQLNYGDALVKFPGNVQRLLAYLALSAPRPRAIVAGNLWPSVSEDRAQGSLRTAIWRVQQECPQLLETGKGALSLTDRVWVDVHDFVATARQLLKQPSDELVIRFSDSALWGELLPGWYEEWVLVERNRLQQLRVHALEALVDQLIRRSRFAAALDAALAAARADPLRESAHRAVVRVYLAEGNRAAAIHHYQGFSHLLQAELGVPPTHAFQQLVTGGCDLPADLPE